MITAPGKVLVANIEVPVANEIYFFDVPQDTTHITIKTRNNSVLKLSFNDMHEYITIPAGAGYYDFNIKFNGAVSFISSANNEIIEIVCWWGQN